MRPLRRRDRAGEERKPARIVPVVVLIGALAAVMGLEFLLFGDVVRRNLDVLLTHPAVAASDPRRPAPLPVLAPPSAGRVTRIELRPLDTCRAGKPCTVLMQVGLRPGTRPLDVAWRFEVVDRCRAEDRHRLPGGTATVPPGHDRLVETGPVDLPPGRSLAVIAVTSQPAVAAGPPMVLPGAAERC